MQRFADGTPCPPYFAGYPPQHAQQAYFPLHTMYENTTEIQYTADVQTEIRRAKPRRRVSLAPSKNTCIAIHEDATNTDGSFGRSAVIDHNMRQSLVAAQPRRRRVSAILSDRLAATESQGSQSGESTTREQSGKRSALKKKARRRTIFIPDDTTVVTIHPGASLGPDEPHRKRRPRSPDLGFDLVTLSEEENEEPLKPAIKERQKKATRKSLAVAPKRLPLAQSMRPRQSVAFVEDTMGTGGGKENVPPEKVLSSVGTRPKSEMTKARLHLGGLPSSPRAPVPTTSRAQAAQVKSPKKRSGSDSILAFSPKPTRVKTSNPAPRATARAAAVVRNVLGHNADRLGPSRSQKVELSAGTSPTIPIPRAARAEASAKIGVPFLIHKGQEQAPKYKVLAEDLAHPELYEDHWLHYQETALTQLLNGILSPLQTYKEPSDNTFLRKKLLSLYHDPQIPLLHKRLQTSLMYGALSVPKDLLSKAARVKDDVGLRRKFLALFSETYDLDALRAASEVVVGREVTQVRRSGDLGTSTSSSHARSMSDPLKGPAVDRLSSGSASSDNYERQTRNERRAIERFLNTFFIKHEDAVRVKGTIASIARGHDRSNDDFGSHAWAWRRTVLRSLMLILLLDQGKQTGAIDCCLFQTSSPHKSSSAVLSALAGLILPSLGDVARPLSHLNYIVEAVQHPLQEYTYTIENLATDLRNGVALTRLVELVSFSKGTLGYADTDQTMTIAMPTGEQLTSTWTRNPADECVLSKHLKFPCAGRPVKLFNVQIALSAVAELGGAAAKAATGIAAEDVVDGHRERTLSLLWSIVGNCGLESLINWQEIKKETRYFSSLSAGGGRIESIADGFLDLRNDDFGDNKTTLSLKKCSRLLLAWVQSITALQGVTVANFTTSFAEHKSFECILDAYLPYFPATSEHSIRQLRSSQIPSSFGAKLKAVGSSAAFISLFDSTTTNNSPIPSKSFTISTLTFLASRLIPIARTHRAASTIQRAYRQRLARLLITQRVISMRLATHCARVVRARERVVGAAVVLQRAWRAVLDRRIDALVKDVVGFQAMARKWLVREKIRGGKIRRQRIRGGW
jgi:abnormal spindle-like microcephaly-associated protein